MPIKFRCTGCRSKLYVPERKRGASIVCPKCETRVMVPASGVAVPTSLEGPDVERSLEKLDEGADEAFAAAPFAVDVRAGGGRRRRAGRRRTVVQDGGPPTARRAGTVTLPAWTPYAFVAALVAVAAGCFALGAWWATAGGGT